MLGQGRYSSQQRGKEAPEKVKTRITAEIHDKARFQKQSKDLTADNQRLGAQDAQVSASDFQEVLEDGFLSCISKPGSSTTFTRKPAFKDKSHFQAEGDALKKEGRHDRIEPDALGDGLKKEDQHDRTEPDHSQWKLMEEEAKRLAEDAKKEEEAKKAKEAAEALAAEALAAEARAAEEAARLAEDAEISQKEKKSGCGGFDVGFKKRLVEQGQKAKAKMLQMHSASRQHLSRQRIR